MSNSPLLGLDIGLHRTGVAFSETGVFAEPLTVLQSNPPHAHTVLPKIVTVVKEHHIQTLVIGLPHTEDNVDTIQAQKVERLIQQLEALLQKEGLIIPIVRINEYHTTKDAAHAYPGKPNDSAAAALILQYYLDHV